MTEPLRPYLGQIIAELEARGVREAVVAPGSRSTPLAILLHESAGIRVRMALDERTAAFFALGMAKASRRPVVVVSTSGTAAANFHPAVAEAYLSRIPLIVLTADRPRELRDVGAAQTINQVNLFGTHVKWFQDLPTPGTADLRPHAAQVASRAVHVAMSHPRGPVHLNVPLREPLLPEPGPAGQPLMGGFVHSRWCADDASLKQVLAWIGSAERPLLALGPESPWVDPAVLERFRASGWPLMVDPLAANGRQDRSLTRYDIFLRAVSDAPRPDVVVRLGAPFTSKVWNQWTGSSRLVLIDWPLGFRDPNHQSALVFEGDPAESLSALSRQLPMAPPDWRQALEQLEERAADQAQRVVSASPASFEGRLYAHLNQLWSDKPVLVASSMAVRDLDSFYDHGPLTFYANRGANGIDGLISTALGISAESGDVLALLGDLAFYHDMNGLHLAQQHQLNALVVILNNSGGGIFSFLPQADLPKETFEELFGTPHRIDFSGAATLYGADFRRVHSESEVFGAFQELRPRTGLRILEWITTPRPETTAVHRQLYAWEDSSWPRN